MNYDPIKNLIQIKPEDARRAVYSLLYAMRHIRKASNLPLDKHERPAALEDPDHAQRGIIQACEALGIDLANGAQWGTEIDLREKP